MLSTSFFNSSLDDMVSSAFTALDILSKDSRSSYGEVFPPTNVYFTEDGNCVLEMAFAGYSRDELSIEIDHNMVTVKVISPAVKSQDTNKYWCHKIKHVACTRKYQLPQNTYDTDKSVASFKDGLLSIIIPPLKITEVKPRTIKISE